MSTVQCPLCGLRYGHRSELDLHAREDHVHRTLVRPVAARPEPVPPPRESGADEHAPVMHLPW
jgi:hypothetical protein